MVSINKRFLCMVEKISSLLVRECFFLRTSLDWAGEEEFRQDKCLMISVERGRATLLVGEEEYVIDRGKLLFLRPELSVRKLVSSADFSVSLIAFPLFMLRECRQRLEPRFMLLLFTKVVWTVDARVKKLFNSFCDLFGFAMEGYGRGYTREMATSLVCSMLYGFYELVDTTQIGEAPVDSSRARELFRRFMELLHQHFAREHEVMFYAGELCISSKYLTQITKGILGHTPKQIIDETLLQEAMRLLDKNDSSIQEISVSLGFPDQSYFGRFFKRLKQMSPQQYRLRSKR